MAGNELSRARHAVTLGRKYIFCLAKLAAIGLTPTKVHRYAIHNIADELGYGFGNKIPPLAAESLCEGPVYVHPGGDVTSLEVVVIGSIARAIKPKIAFEIGTFQGRTTANIAANCAQTAVVYTLDLPPSEGSSLSIERGDKPHFKAPGPSGDHMGARIVQLYGNSATYDFSEFRGKANLIFVDGAHSFEYVMKDSLTSIEMLSEGGVILWHDYGPTWPDVTRALQGLLKTDPRFANLVRIEGTSLAYLSP
jgi:Methyltransferase domain